MPVRLVNTLTCPLEVSDDQFVTQVTGMTAPFVSLLCPLRSDWRDRRLLALIDAAGNERDKSSSITRAISNTLHADWLAHRLNRHASKFSTDIFLN